MDNQVDVLAFPAPKWHEGDGGPYIGTECMVITKDPDFELGQCRHLPRAGAGRENADALHRARQARRHHPQEMVGAGRGLARWWSASARRRRWARPRLDFSPENVCEFDVAGGRIGRPIKLVKGQRHRRAVPADAELVFEGFMPPPRGTDHDRRAVRRVAGLLRLRRGRSRCCRSRRSITATTRSSRATPPAQPTYPGTLVRHRRLGADPRRGALGRAGSRRRAGHQGRLEDAGRRRALHQCHRDQAAASRPRQDGRPGRGRLRLGDLYRAHHHHRRRRYRHHQPGRGDVGGGARAGTRKPRPTSSTVCGPAISTRCCCRSSASSGDLTNSRIIIYAVRPFHWKDQFPKVNAVDPAYAAEVARKWKGTLKFLDTIAK